MCTLLPDPGECCGVGDAPHVRLERLERGHRLAAKGKAGAVRVGRRGRQHPMGVHRVTHTRLRAAVAEVVYPLHVHSTSGNNTRVVVGVVVCAMLLPLPLPSVHVGEEAVVAVRALRGVDSIELPRVHGHMLCRCRRHHGGGGGAGGPESTVCTAVSTRMCAAGRVPHVRGSSSGGSVAVRVHPCYGRRGDAPVECARRSKSRRLRGIRRGRPAGACNNTLLSLVVGIMSTAPLGCPRAGRGRDVAPHRVVHHRESIRRGGVVVVVVARVVCCGVVGGAVAANTVQRHRESTSISVVGRESSPHNPSTVTMPCPWGLPACRVLVHAHGIFARASVVVGVLRVRRCVRPFPCCAVRLCAVVQGRSLC